MKKKIMYLPLCAACCLLVACSDYLDINDDPNNPVTVDASLILPSAQMHITGIMNGDYAILGGIWSQHWTQSHVASQYRDEDRYGLRNSDYNGAWRDLYSDALIDLEMVRKQATDSENWAIYLQATSLMAFAYQTLADFYDQIPFSEALRGDEGIESPKFDDGQSIYEGLITMIDDALSKDVFGPASKGASTDFVFGHLSGDAQIQAWIDFANTLKLKIFLRQTKARPDVAQQGIAPYLSGQVSLLKEDAAVSAFSDAPNQSYPLFETDRRQLNVTSNLRASNTLISYLVSHGDPRIDVLFTPGSGGHMGLRQGDFNALTTDIPPAAPSIANLSPTSSFYFFTMDEIHFILAEAHTRYGNSEQAQSHYESAVRECFARLGLDAEAFITDNGSYAFPAGSSEEQLQMILTQKWIAMVERGYESFFDHNRTGIPAVSIVDSDDPAYIPGQWTYSVTGTTNGQFPKRLIFPDITRRNNANTPPEQSITEPVWWAR